MAKLDNNDHSGRYNAGKKIVSEEYGVVYPDGTVEWDRYARRMDGDIRTPEGRAEALTSWRRQLERLNAQVHAMPVIIKRTKTTKFSDITYVID